MSSAVYFVNRQRGGGWNAYYHMGFISFTRYHSLPEDRTEDTGLRTVISASALEAKEQPHKEGDYFRGGGQN